MMRLLKLLSPNAILTVATCGVLGPAVSKLEHLFGLVGWPARAPFYLLQLYVTPAILLLNPGRRSYMWGPMVGLACTIPLASWSVATKCPPVVPIGYLLSGTLQGLVIGWLAIPRKHATGGVPPVEHRV